MRVCNRVAPGLPLGKLAHVATLAILDNGVNLSVFEQYAIRYLPAQLVVKMPQIVGVHGGIQSQRTSMTFLAVQVSVGGMGPFVVGGANLMTRDTVLPGISGSAIVTQVGYQEQHSHEQQAAPQKDFLRTESS